MRPCAARRAGHGGDDAVGQRQSDCAEQKGRAENWVAIDQERGQDLIVDHAEPARCAVRMVRCDSGRNLRNGALDALHVDRACLSRLFRQRRQADVGIGGRRQSELGDQVDIGNAIRAGDVAERHPGADAAGRRRTRLVGRAQQTKRAISSHPKPHGRKHDEQKDHEGRPAHPAGLETKCHRHAA